MCSCPGVQEEGAQIIQRVEDYIKLLQFIHPVVKGMHPDKNIKTQASFAYLKKAV